MTEIRIRRGPASQLPADAAAGEPLLTTDTHNIYVGGGPGVMPVKVTGVTTEVQAALAMKVNAVDLGTAAAKDVPATGNASAGQVVLGNDSRLSNSRTPTAHKTSHAIGGTDALTPADIGLGNVDNTADADKPVSTATQAALDDKADSDGRVIITAGNIQEGIDAAVGKVAYFNGDFTTTTTINLPSHTHLVFAAGATLKNLTTDADLFGHISDTDNADITIEGGTFEGNPAGTAQHLAHFAGISSLKAVGITASHFAEGLDFYDCPDFIARDNIMSYGNRGILTYGTSKGDITDNNISYVHGNAIEYLSTGDAIITGNRCWHNADTGIAAAGIIHSRMTITGNSCCYNGGGGISGALNEGINVHGLTEGIISNNTTCFNSSHGIDINGLTGASPTNRSKNTVVVGNVSTDNGDTGIILSNVKYTICDANVCARNAGNIIVQGVETYGVKITNNNLLDSTAASGSTGNMHINGGGDILIENNIMGEDTSVPAGNLKQLWVTDNVTGGVLIGYNDYSKATFPMAVYIAATRDKVDFKHKQIFASDEINLSSVPTPVTAYTSNFTASADGFANQNGSVVAGNVDGINGVDDVLRVYATNGTTTHYAQRAGSFAVGRRYRVTASVYLPNSETHVTGLRIYNANNSGDMGGDFTTSGAWTTWTSSDFTATGTSLFLQLLPFSNFTGANSSTDDVAYVKNIVIQELVGGVVETPVPIYAQSKYSCIWKAYAVYTEQTSADAGVTVGIGKGALGHTYWATGTTGSTQAVGSKLDLTINRNGSLDTTDYKPFFYSLNNKTGAGKIRIVCEYLPNVPIYY